MTKHELIMIPTVTIPRQRQRTRRSRPRADSGRARRLWRRWGRRSTASIPRPSPAARACRCWSSSRDGDGTWLFGQKQTIAEDGSRWAINPRSFQRGFICFGDGNKKLGERLLPVSQPMPDSRTPRQGLEWQEQWAVNLKCLSGTDAGIEVIFKTDDRRRHPGHRRTDRGGARSPQRRPARRQGLADRAAGKGLLSAPPVREDLDAAADDRRLDAAGRSGAAPAPPSPTSPPRRRAAAPPPRRLTPMRT